MASNGTRSPDLLRVYERFALPVFPMVGDTGFEPVSRVGSLVSEVATTALSALDAGDLGSVRSVLNLLSRLGGPS